MRKELVDVGFIELKNKVDVDTCLSSENETLLLLLIQFADTPKQQGQQ